MSDAAENLVSDRLLDEMRERAAGYDEGNEFPDADLAALREAGYLRALVPTELGGLGFGLRDVTRIQRRIANAAPATALALGMHQVWTSVAKVLRDRGDDSLTFVLEDAAKGEVFAFGISEPGNDLMLFDSNTRAEPVEGGYRYTGTKIFGSLSPVWTRLGIFGRDDSGESPQLVYGMLHREDGGFRIDDDWDMLGMRATRSCTTHLEGAVVPEERIIRKLAPGPQPDALIFGIFASFLLIVSSAYVGLAERALALAVQAATRRTSKRRGGASLASDEIVRYRLADMKLRLDLVTSALDTLARAVDEHDDLGADWFPRLVGVKTAVAECAEHTVSEAMKVAGGASFVREGELARLWRDVAAAAYHPSNDQSAHQTIANALLGPVKEA